MPNDGKKVTHRRKPPSRPRRKARPVPAVTFVYESPPAEIFSPHAFQTRVEYAGEIPMVYVTREVYSRMWHFVDIAEQEVGWLGTVEKTAYGNFLITEVFLLNQQVTAAETEISEDGIVELTEELLMRDNGLEAVNSLRFWGHSHVMMGTNASSQDDQQMVSFRENGSDWFVRGILNKRGRMEFTIYLFNVGVRIADVPWAILEPIDDSMRAAIEAEFDAKVVERQFGPQFNGPWDETGDGGDFDPAFLRMGAEGPLDVRYFEGEEEEDER